MVDTFPMRKFLLLVFLAIGSAITSAADQGGIQMPWGRIEPAGIEGRWTVRVKEWPTNRMVAMPRPFPNVVAGWVGEGQSPQPLYWMFNQDASQMRLGLPQRKPEDRPHPLIHLITSEKSGTLADGVIVLSALDARVRGQRARLETHPGNHRIGFWVDANDTVEWDFVTRKDGNYRVELAYSQAGQAGTEVDIVIDNRPVSVRLGATGTWYAYTSMKTGQVSLKPGSHRVVVRCTRQLTPAVMNLKAIVLHPTGK